MPTTIRPPTHPLLLLTALLACGADTTTSDAPGSTSTTTTSTEPEPEPTSIGTTGASDLWPRRVTLETPGLVEPSPAIRLADGLLDDDGDLRLYQTMVLTLRSPTAETVCTKGTFASLADIPTSVDDCPGDPLSPVWHDYASLDAATIHTEAESNAIGLGLLVRDAELTTLYRLRILGDSYSAATGRSTVTFDYEPVSAP